MGRGKKRTLGRAGAIPLSDHGMASAAASATSVVDAPADAPAGVPADAIDTSGNAAHGAAKRGRVALSADSGTSHLTPKQIGERLAAAGAVRDMSASTWTANREEWKRKEREFTTRVSHELHQLLKDFASSDGNWAEFVRLYARAPHYSPTNMWLAWAQLARKGVDSEGIVLSETGWKALGRTIKPGYKRTYKTDEEGRPLWDDTYAAEMTAPMIVPDRRAAAAESTATPQTPAEAAAKGSESQGRPSRGGRVIGYKAFDVYHEQATESKDGQELPKPPWYGATGSDEDAAKLWADVEKICEWQGIELELASARAADPRLSNNLPEIRVASANYDRAANKLRVVAADTQAAQAVAALSALCDHFGPSEPAKDDDEVKARVLARESAAYAIASLYGLEASRQAFAFLADVAQDDKALKRVSKDVERRVSTVVGYLDPVMRLKARGEVELKGKYEESRSAKRARQRKAPKGARSRKSALAG